jgi:hypothetical protein
MEFASPGLLGKGDKTHRQEDARDDDRSVPFHFSQLLLCPSPNFQ